MSIWLYSILSVFLVSLISLIGVFTLAISDKLLRKILLFLVSFAVGALFGDAFIHLLPQAFESSGFRLSTSIYVLFGILIFFILEKFLRWRHCHDINCQEHSKHLVVMNLVGDAVHNLIDGMLIGASYQVSISLGIATTTAIIFHEIPQEIGKFGVLVHAGLKVKRALFLNFLSALVAIFGTASSLLLGPYISGFTTSLIPITAGGFIYIAGSDLIPELHREEKPWSSFAQLIFITGGLGIMILLTIVE